MRGGVADEREPRRARSGAAAVLDDGSARTKPSERYTCFSGAAAASEPYRAPSARARPLSTSPMKERAATAEDRRLAEDAARSANWKRWGPYLSERQWGTVREDYSKVGAAWDDFPHDHARRRAYRWGEDGLLGITDRQCRLCFALALWNGRDPILKERLFGLTGTQGNHGEDVKESYFYLDSTPTHSYMRALYKYPQREYPYARLVEENARRGKDMTELELADTGAFDEHRYFDVEAEYAKAAPEDLLIRITVRNRGPEPAPLALLPTLWFRNTWSWSAGAPKPAITVRDGVLAAEHEELGTFRLAIDDAADAGAPELLFTENETDAAALFGGTNAGPYVKDAFHEYVIRGRRDAVHPSAGGTKAAALFRLAVPAARRVRVQLRLSAAADAPRRPFGKAFDEVFATRQGEADLFYASRLRADLGAEERRVARQAYAGLLWTKQFYHYVMPTG